MSDLKTKISDDMKDAMRAKDKVRLGVIRLILAAIQQKEVDERIDLDDAGVLAVLDKMVKQRRESIAQFDKAGRDELSAKEQSEIGIIQHYLPAQMDEAEIEAMIAEAIASTGATEMKDMGKVMGIIRPKLQGRADMGDVSSKIKAQLAG